MKPEELRVGNIVDTAVGIIRIEEIPLKSNPLYNPNALHPIPLSPEWLERFGFRSDVKGWYWKSTSKNSYIAHNPYGFYLSITDHDDESDSNKKDEFSEKLNVEYVHQLQNLYYALTGKELELKQ